MAVVKLSELRWGRVCAVLKLSQIGEQFGLAEGGICVTSHNPLVIVKLDLDTLLLIKCVTAQHLHS